MMRSMLQVTLLLLIVLPGVPSVSCMKLSGKDCPNHSANSRFLDFPFDEMDERTVTSGYHPILTSAFWDSPAIPTKQSPFPAECLSHNRAERPCRAYIRHRALLI